MRVFLLALALAAVSAAADAQTICTSACTVYTAQAFSVQADDTTNTVANLTGYRLYDGAAMVSDKLVAAVRAGTVVTFDFPTGLAATGAHNYSISAYNPAGVEGPKSPAIALTVNAAPPTPTAPTNTRIVK